MKSFERIVALGGAGNMGRVAVRTAASLEGIGEIVVADRNLASAERVAAEAGRSAKAKLRAERIDVTDSAALNALLGGAGAVLNTTGPFYKFALPILRAAIQTGTHYLDICDDWEPTIEMMRLNRSAAEAGATAVIGLGASPGVSNLMAKMAAHELDEVEDLYTAWPVDVPMAGAAIIEEREGLVDASGAPSAAMIHFMQQISGAIRVVEGGQLVDRPPLAAVELEFPGRGRGCAYTVGHPEPLTMRETLRIRGRSACLVVLSTGALALLKYLGSALDRKRLTNQQAAAIMLAPGTWQKIRAGLRMFGLKGPGELPAFFALALGRKSGKAARAGVTVTAFPAGMANATGVPLALGLGQLIEGRIQARGVFAPEAVMEPERLFDQIAPYCVPPAHRGSDFVKVTVEAG